MKKRNALLLTTAGLLLIAAGLLLLRTSNFSTDNLSALPYLLTGVGCGVFGHGKSKLINGMNATCRSPTGRKAKLKTR